jgi:hypothetical protein
MTTRHDLPVRTYKSRDLELDVLETAGPRVISLRYKGSANLFASVPDIAVPTPYGDFHYIGGHRLWYSPEAMPRSYIPDNEGVDIFDVHDGVILTGKREQGTGIRKQIKIQLHSDSPRVTLTHTLYNEGLWDVELAPWTITMFRLGGTAILPLQAEDVDPDGLLPDRGISLWPYSKIHDPRLQIDDDAILVSTMQRLPLFKIGTFNPRGWLAYWNDGILFQKKSTITKDATYPDHGCNAEIYCDEHFIELETLAPMKTLVAGDSVIYTEEWELFDSPDQDFLPLHIVERLK